MQHYLPSSQDNDARLSLPAPTGAVLAGDTMADLKIFWGPEICRLEYLVHLLQTGRIKDEYLALIA